MGCELGITLEYVTEKQMRKYRQFSSAFFVVKHVLTDFSISINKNEKKCTETH